MRLARLSRRALCKAALATTAISLVGRDVSAQNSMLIAAVNYPLVYFAERLTQGLAEVRFPVPIDTDPSFWRPNIADIAEFQSADLILLNGAGFAAWTARTTLPRARIVHTSSAFEDDYISIPAITHSHGESGEHSHSAIASYVWLDFNLARRQAEAIARAVIRRAPETEADITANLAGLSADLAALDDAAREIASLAEGVAMIASHPRSQYFARAYGATIDALEWDAAGSVSEEQWRDLEALIGQTGARIFIWEAEPETSATTRIEALGLRNVVFPPLANRPSSGNFISNMSASIADLTSVIRNISEN